MCRCKCDTCRILASFAPQRTFPLHPQMCVVNALPHRAFICSPMYGSRAATTIIPNSSDAQTHSFYAYRQASRQHLTRNFTPSGAATPQPCPARRLIQYLELLPFVPSSWPPSYSSQQEHNVHHDNRRSHTSIPCIRSGRELDGFLYSAIELQQSLCRRRNSRCSLEHLLARELHGACRSDVLFLFAE